MSTDPTASGPTSTPGGTVSAGRPRAAAPGPRRALLALLVAVAVALLVWAVAALLLDVPLEVAQGGQPMTIGAVPVIIATLVAGLFGWGVSALLSRVAGHRAPLVWVVLAVLGTVLSLVGPLTSGGETSTVTVLVLLHLVVAAVLIPGLRPGSGSRA
ncbi:DUF6069 family protein [Auraticoccus monumenti]|uniref:Uncharacterized protein n=1 Tax=Auraticoccus monumenti TaxID=675864 RepID=A0A1G6ZZ74_9ACTN|nr:DUF6069 family protein [Auraticoccus monumenti]SDE07135.1 hypothetical protein SAMN04489747_2432 [Auraticoccus monumenti]